MDYSKITNFHLVGCGGVGTKFLRDTADSRQFKIENITFWDSDIIEEKNLVRQLFTKEEIGMSKSDVLHNRMDCSPYSNLMAESGMVSSLGDFSRSNAVGMGLANKPWEENTIIFMATDNLESRVLSLELLDKWGGEDSMVLSAANADAADGVGLGCTAWIYRKEFKDTDKDPRTRHDLSCKEQQVNTGRPCAESESSQTNIANSGASQRAIELLTIWTSSKVLENKKILDAMPVEHSLFWRQAAL
jgi:hypothetical protein